MAHNFKNDIPEVGKSDYPSKLATICNYLGDGTAGDGTVTGDIVDIEAKTDHITVTQAVNLDTIETKVTDAGIKTAYENNADTNAYTDAEKAIVAATSGTNTGDQDKADIDALGVDAATITIGTNTPTDSTMYLALLGNATGSDQIDTDAELQYDASTDTLKPTDILITDTASFSSIHDYGTISGTAQTIDWNNGNKQKITLGNNITFTFTNPQGIGDFRIVLVQDATGGRTLTWPASCKFIGGSTPILSTSPNAIDIANVFYDGTTYYVALSKSWG